MCIEDENTSGFILTTPNSMDDNEFNWTDQRSKKNVEKIKRREANMEKHKKYFAPLPALLEMMGASEDDEEKIEKKEVERKRRIELEKKCLNINIKEEEEKLMLLFEKDFEKESKQAEKNRQKQENKKQKSRMNMIWDKHKLKRVLNPKKEKLLNQEEKSLLEQSDPSAKAEGKKAEWEKNIEAQRRMGIEKIRKETLAKEQEKEGKKMVIEKKMDLDKPRNVIAPEKEKELNKEVIERHQENIVEAEDFAPAFNNIPEETYLKPEKARRQHKIPVPAKAEGKKMVILEQKKMELDKPRNVIAREKEKELNKEVIEAHQEYIIEAEDFAPAFNNIPEETYLKPERILLVPDGISKRKYNNGVSEKKKTFPWARNILRKVM